MLIVAYYFLQVCLCSAVMMGYYALVLRNKRFHQYNRFYLLGVAILPWLVPLVKIEINKPVITETLPVQLFAVIADANSEFEQTVAAKGFQLTWDVAATLLYATVSSIFLITLLVALLRIYRLLKVNACKHLDDVFLVLTKANGTPFSFFKFIFWNTDIDVTTHTGKQMLQHELTHVKEKHSADKLLLQLVLIFGWFNPIFWLLKRELETIHEFIADNKTIANGDTATLATMLLTAAYPQQRFALTNPFFYSPIKRRIAMLTNNTNPTFSYARRVVVLPLLVAVTLLFAFRKKEDKAVIVSMATVMEKMANAVTDLAEVTVNTNKKPTNFAPIILNKTYTVVIDAGHGGADAGASGIDGKSYEKDIALSIAKLVKAQNANANINIVLTRDNDVYMTPVEKVAVANKANPDLFVSVHCNYNDLAAASNKPLADIEIFIANKQKAKNYDANYQFAAALSSKLVEADKKDNGILTRAKGIWVLQEVNCPSALVECGYMDNKAELEKLKNASYQQAMATNILKGIETYLANKESDRKAVIVDTFPSKKAFVTDLNGTLHATVDIDMKDGTKFKKGDSLSLKIITRYEVPKYKIILYNSKVITQKEFDTMYLRIGESVDINVVKATSIINKFGENSKDGVVVIRPKTKDPLYILDGKVINQFDINSLNPALIKCMNVLKDKSATDKYGDEGIYGVIEIFLKKDVNDTIVKVPFNALLKDNPIATQRATPIELKKFQQVSADISEVYWVGSIKKLIIRIQHQNGSIETYDLFDTKNKNLALTKYNEDILYNCKSVLKAIEDKKKLLKA